MRPYDFSRLDALVIEHLDRTFPCAQIEILVEGAPVYGRVFGYLDPETRTHPVTCDTRFDLASVSKLFTVTAFMTLVEQNRVALDQPVVEVLPEFTGLRPITPYPDPLQPGAHIRVETSDLAPVDAQSITFRHLLAHNSGLPAWLPLWQIAKREERRIAALQAAFAYPPGAHVIYSDIGLILLGFAMEKVAAQSLDQIIRERVTAPLGLDSVGHGPIPREMAAPTEYFAHQNRRMCGEVHDENARSFGGVAGHAGLFGTARDVAKLGEMFRQGGSALLKQETLAEMTRVQSEEGAVRRGLGFLLWSPDPVASSHPLSEKAFGHMGFTGTSLWIDPARELVIACLTNRVYYGRTNADAIAAFRLALHRAVSMIVEGSGSV
jgi:CubicO group peptidase (beta-lactamase class C family)